MSTHRVLWTDSNGDGRFADVDAPNEAQATWSVAVSAGQGTTFVAVAALPAPAE